MSECLSAGIFHLRRADVSRLKSELHIISPVDSPKQIYVLCLSRATVSPFKPVPSGPRTALSFESITCLYESLGRGHTRL